MVKGVHCTLFLWYNFIRGIVMERYEIKKLLDEYDSKLNDIGRVLWRNK